MKILAFILLPTVLASGSENNGRGAKAVSLANAFVAIADNPWAASYNPAGLSQLTSIQLTGFIVPQQFGLTELRTTALAVASPIAGGAIGITIEQFGFDLYRETLIGAGCGFAIDPDVALGVTMNLQGTSIEGYGNATSLILDAGLFGKISDKVSIGFAFKNITGSTIGELRERLPQVLSLGGCYRPLDDFFIVGEVEKDIRFPAVVKVGIAQRLLDILDVRLGLSNNPDKVSAGVSFSYSFAEFGYAGYSHPDLGWTHQIEVSIRGE
jgi:hypothetical protein